MPSRLTSSLVLSFAILSFTPATGQNLMSPADFLGYELGERFTRHHAIVDYVKHVAANSDVVTVEQYGETNEGRPLMLAYITSADNQGRINEIRQNHLRVAGTVDGAPEGKAHGIVWLSYGVHGNESSSSEAAMKTLYALANGDSDDVAQWLNDVVVILDPCVNPDGRDRYVNWFNGQVGRLPDEKVYTREHSEPWPGGRSNHYYFDLNRDWAWVTQKETAARIPFYNNWLPHVHVDFHEQGINEPYYFAPAAEPYHELITDGQREVERLIGENNSQYFDANDWLYFKRERFDLLYPGYGDTWPTFNGAVGMTYEQAGHSRGGLKVMNDEDFLLTLTDRIDHHHTAGLSTIEAVYRNLDLVVQEFANFYSAAAEGVGQYKSFIVRRSGSEDNADALGDLLSKQGISFGYASASENVNGFNYRAGDDGRFQINAGDIVIPAAQPKSRLLAILMEPQTVLADSATYDITAWSLPYAYNVDALATDEVVNYTTDAPQPAVRSVEPEAYAYLLSWNGVDDARVLSDLLQQGVKVRMAMEEFQANGQLFDRGTLVVTAADNAALNGSLAEIVDTAAGQFGQPVATLQSGSVDSGKDLGSGSVVYLKAPRVMMLTSPSISSYATGELWNYFDNELRYPVSMINADDLGSVTLSDYDVMVLPTGSYRSILDDNTLGSVTDWVRDGGRIVAFEAAAGFFSGKDGFLIERRSPASPDTTVEARLRRFEDRTRSSLSDRVSGSIYRVQIDNSHPLAFGYTDQYFTLKRTASSFDLLSRGWNVGAVLEEEPVAGFAGSKTGPRVKDSLLWGHQTLGGGDVVYFADAQIFRGFWHGGMLAIANAVFLVGQ